jgi:putative transposase
MKTSNNFRTGRHCVFNLHVHLVFVTKYRRKIFTKRVLKEISQIFSNVCLDFDASLIECSGEKDHVHLLVNYPPTTSISKLINSLKGVSSRLIRKKKYPEVENSLWKNSLWSPSYFAGSCGGAPISIIREYIEKQDSPKN